MSSLTDLSSKIIDSGVADVPVNRVTEELTELADGLAIVESFSHSVVVRTDEGAVAFDASGKKSGGAVAGAIAAWTDVPVTHLVYTRPHRSRGWEWCVRRAVVGTDRVRTRTVQVPNDILAKPYLRPLYDEPEFVVRGVWRQFGGWWDGAASRLEPAPGAVVGGVVAQLAGGTAALVERARDEADRGNPRLACHLVDFAGWAAPDDPEVHAARAETYMLRRRHERSLMSKGDLRRGRTRIRRRCRPHRELTSTGSSAPVVIGSSSLRHLRAEPRRDGAASNVHEAQQREHEGGRPGGLGGAAHRMQWGQRRRLGR